MLTSISCVNVINVCRYSLCNVAHTLTRNTQQQQQLWKTSIMYVEHVKRTLTVLFGNISAAVSLLQRINDYLFHIFHPTDHIPLMPVDIPYQHSLTPAHMTNPRIHTCRCQE